MAADGKGFVSHLVSVHNWCVVTAKEEVTSIVKGKSNRSNSTSVHSFVPIKLNFLCTFQSWIECEVFRVAVRSLNFYSKWILGSEVNVADEIIFCERNAVINSSQFKSFTELVVFVSTTTRNNWIFPTVKLHNIPIDKTKKCQQHTRSTQTNRMFRWHHLHQNDVFQGHVWFLFNQSNERWFCIWVDNWIWMRKQTVTSHSTP